jgi:hypothetical protein
VDVVAVAELAVDVYRDLVVVVVVVSATVVVGVAPIVLSLL